jgi:hypothetical protein
VLQMVNLPVISMIQELIDAPSKLEYLLDTPALYNLAHAGPFVLEDVLAISTWISRRAKDILGSLSTNEALGMDKEIVTGNWVKVGQYSHLESNMLTCHILTHKTGCLYSMPQVRYRPVYPSLRYDQKREKSGRRGAKCSKFFAQYGQQRLTGGILAAWCTHSICYGFHCIPESEGRNDVFSAMITHWPVAPKTVVYDFACALGPYCMTREPDFFANTRFLIDHFHSTGHSKCSRACFLTTYTNVDPGLAKINSSAAECGNGGIRKIRKM